MPLLPAAAGLVLSLASAASAAGTPCANESVAAVERVCVQEGPASVTGCRLGLDVLWRRCQEQFRVAGRQFPPASGPGSEPTRRLRVLRAQHLGVSEPDAIAGGTGVPRRGDRPDQRVPVEDEARPARPLLAGDGHSDRGHSRAGPAAGAPDRAGPEELAGYFANLDRMMQEALSTHERASVPPADERAAHVAAPERPLAGAAVGGAVAAGLGLQSSLNAGMQELVLAAEMAELAAQGFGSPGPSQRVQAPAAAAPAAPRAGGDATAPLVAAALFNFAGQPRRAEAAATEAIRAAGERSAPAFQLRAEARLQEGDAAGAAEDARKALRLDPENAQAKRVLGQARELAAGAARVGKMRIGFGEKGELDLAGMSDRADGADGAVRAGGAPSAQAQAAAAAAIVLPPVSAAVRGAPAPVRRWLEGLAPREFESQPQELQRLWGSALENAALGRWKPALLDATLLTQAHPREAGPWLLRSKVLGRLSNWKAAESDARKALETAPEDPAALLELGYALVQQGRAEEGLAVIDRALARRDSGLGQLYRAEALEKLGRVPEAVAAYRLAQSLDPVLAPLVEPALARLAPQPFASASAAGKGSAPWRRTLLAVSALLAGLLALAGAAKAGWLGGSRPRTPDEPAPATGSAPLTARPGEMLGGHFRVERELARGGMGVVYLATDTVLQRPVAVKRLNREAVASEDARRKFIQEAQLAARLKHPNLAQIHSVFGEHDLHLVFEYVEGRGLDAVLGEKGRLSLRETREVLRQVCAALAHAHEARVIHRDLKPANVMLEPGGGCKILDFGIAHEARTVSHATLTQAWGTPPYMAPEQEEGLVSAASDLYAVGVMAYELLSGSRPFEGAGQLGLKRSGSFKTLAGRHGLPPEVDRFFARALNPDPARRFTRAADLYAAFDELAGTPVRS